MTSAFATTPVPIWNASSNGRPTSAARSPISPPPAGNRFGKRRWGNYDPSRFAFRELLRCALDAGFPPECVLELQIDIRPFKGERESSRVVVAQRLQVEDKRLVVLPASLGG